MGLGFRASIPVLVTGYGNWALAMELVVVLILELQTPLANCRDNVHVKCQGAL